MSEPSLGKLKIWTCSDGRAGIENQVLGLAEAIDRKIPVELRRITVKRTILPAPKFAKKTSVGMDPPWPNIWIGCGRASLPYSAAMRKWSGSKTFVVQLQDPRRAVSLFDLVIAPGHDQLSGENVVSMTGAPNRISVEKLQASAEQFSKRIATLSKPLLAVVIGGNSKRYKLTKERFSKLMSHLEILNTAKVSLLITTSRRTPGFAIRRLRKFAKKTGQWVWTGHKEDGENPYFAFLHLADAIIATNDSTNMLADAASAGKPILLFALQGEAGKFSHLHDDLEARGFVRPFTGSVSTWPVERLDETGRVADEILRRYYQHLNNLKQQH